MDCTVMFSRTGAFVKVLFWTDSGNILGLVPASGSAYVARSILVILVSVAVQSSTSSSGCCGVGGSRRANCHADSPQSGDRREEGWGRWEGVWMRWHGVG